MLKLSGAAGQLEVNLTVIPPVQIKSKKETTAHTILHATDQGTLQKQAGLTLKERAKEM